MPDFTFTKHPVFSPTRCAACSTHACAEGFVDMVASTATAGFHDGAPMPPAPDEPTYGRLYLCARCVWEAARRVGCLDPQQAAQLREEHEQCGLMLEQAKQLVEEERASKVVTLADVERLVTGLQAKAAAAKKAAAKAKPEAA